MTSHPRAILRRRAQHGHTTWPGTQPRSALLRKPAVRIRPPGRRGWRSDEGAGAVEMVIAVPLLMLLILLVVQFALWAHASAVAQATAEEALAAARVQGGSAAAGQQRAHQVLAQIGGAVLAGPRIIVTRSPVTATVQITGTAERVLPVPGLAVPVTVTVTGPVERFVPGG
jgi:Flp pilus assembly protein TadG